MSCRLTACARVWDARCSLLLGAMLCAWLGIYSEAQAHAFAPSLLEIQEAGDGAVTIRWKTSLLQQRGSALEPILPAECAPAGEIEEQVVGTGLVRSWRAGCVASQLVGAPVGVRGLSASRSAALVRYRFRGGHEGSALLQGQEETVVIAGPQRPAQVVQNYLFFGFSHILSGPDHLLFVFGLVLLTVGLRTLLYTVTAFTLGHSVTLALSALGWIQLPTAAVEVAIAVSLVVVALELARPRQTAPGLLQRRPWLIAAGFGMLHGLGFAGALREAGLPGNEIPLALFSFNLGIELGQLLFVGIVLAGGALLARLPLRPAPWLRLVPAYTIGSLAVYWCLERSIGLWD